MTERIELPNAIPGEISGQLERARWCCGQLEEGNILFFSSTPFQLPADDVRFLLSQHQSGARIHKNIAYRPAQDRLTGYAADDPGQVAQLRAVLRRYSQESIRFTSNLLTPYAGAWRIDFASFRPQEEKGRQIRTRARNDLLHFDSFPTRPTNGDRILRIFTNLNSQEPRVWVTSETFEALAPRFAGAGMPMPKGTGMPRRVAIKLARTVGLTSLSHSPYDRWMLNFHHFLKANDEFQQTTPRAKWEFPPGSTWLVFTDMVGHAVLSGQFALEQTFIVSRHSQVKVGKAPVKILERLSGSSLTVD